MIIGDEVEIINYGALVWQWKWIGWETWCLKIYKEEKDIIWIDIMPNIVGEKAIICEISPQGKIGINPLKKGVPTRWYNEDQLKN